MKKTFDAVSWMRKKREQIDKEDVGLTWEEKKQKTHAAICNDPLWQRLKSRVVSETKRQTEGSGDNKVFVHR